MCRFLECARMVAADPDDGTLYEFCGQPHALAGRALGIALGHPRVSAAAAAPPRELRAGQIWTDGLPSMQQVMHQQQLAPAARWSPVISRATRNSEFVATVWI